MMTKVSDLSLEDRDRLAKTLAGERDVAIQERKSLERIWDKARKQYQGIEHYGPKATTREKGETLEGPISSYQVESKRQGSSVVVNITRPYTNAGTARVADILIPTSRLPFELRETPISDAETLRKALVQFPQLVPLLETLAPEVAKRLTQDPLQSKAAMEGAFLMIKDWLKETDWAGAMRTQVIESGKVGTGVIKGPFPKARKLQSDVEAMLAAIPTGFPQQPELGKQIQAELKTMLQYQPFIESIKVENCFPDPECGSDVQNGRYFFERVPEITRRQLEEYKQDGTYDSEMIDKCLDQGPQPVGGDESRPDGPFELWIRTGMLRCKKSNEGKDEEIDYGFQVTTLCNDHIIKSEAFWLDKPVFPYWLLLWEEREDSWAGIGIPEQIETPQRGVNTSARALMDNMGFSVGPQVLELDGLIEPVDGDWMMHAYKRWRVKSAIPGVDAMAEAKQALSFLEFPNYLEQIMPVIQYWMKMAEDTTGLTLLLQGQAVTDAVGVSQQLMNNATTNLRLIVKEWDSRVCYPLMTAYYEWTQLYGPDSVKGDAVVEPLGSAALIVRELQQQALLQIGDRVLQPIYGISPSKWMKLYLEGFQVDYEALKMTDAEQKQLREAEAQPDPKIVVAQIEAQAEVYKADIKQEAETLKLAMDAHFRTLEASQEEAARNLDARIKSFMALLDSNTKIEGQRMGIEGAADAAASGPAVPSPPPAGNGVSSPPSAPAPVDVEAALDTLGFQV